MRKGIFTALIVVAALVGSPGQAAAESGGALNVLLLTVDSFRPDRLGCYGCERAHTPNIDRLAERGVLFEDAFSTASWTNASNISILTGMYPSLHGVERRGESFPRQWTSPLEVLDAAGWLVPQINYLFPMPNYRNLGFTPNRIRDAAEFLAEYRDSTFFAWYHFHGPHLPYEPPEEFARMFLGDGATGTESLKAVREQIVMRRGEREFSPAEQRTVSALYDAEVAAQDRELGHVLDTLDSLELAESTVVILTADHGEELFEHGWLGHASTSLRGTLYDEVIRIPLIVSMPGTIPGGGRSGALVQGVDIMPTLFELLGLEPSAPFQGVSFLGELMSPGAAGSLREQIFCETSVCGYQCPDSAEVAWLKSVRTDSFKLIQTVEPGGGPAYELYHLAEDPGEIRNVYGDFPGQQARLHGLLAEQAFRNSRLRSSRLAQEVPPREDAAASGGEERIEISYPAEDQVVSFTDHGGRVPVSWTGREGAVYVIEYSVGQGKYHMEGSFEVEGTGETFGPFSRMFWKSFPQYNPWRFRVAPRGRPGLASEWREFGFE